MMMKCAFKCKIEAPRKAFRNRLEAQKLFKYPQVLIADEVSWFSEGMIFLSGFSYTKSL